MAKKRKTRTALARPTKKQLAQIRESTELLMDTAAAANDLHRRIRYMTENTYTDEVHKKFRAQLAELNAKQISAGKALKAALKKGARLPKK